jgi:hypothetical protein
MAFYHQDGFNAAWKQSEKFIGKDGRFATMPDIVAARLATKPGDLPWETYFTTLTAEYLGQGKNGNPILIVAHGIGPMSTLNGIRKAYSYQYKDKTRSHQGGQITVQEFLNLEARKYGEVSIIDLKKYCLKYEYPFMESRRLTQALTDEVEGTHFLRHIVHGSIDIAGCIKQAAFLI